MSSGQQRAKAERNAEKKRQEVGAMRQQVP